MVKVPSFDIDLKLVRNVDFRQTGGFSIFPVLSLSLQLQIVSDR